MIVLALGTNLGNRFDNLLLAQKQLEIAGFEIIKRSYVYETAALLPQNATQDWQKNYLNMALTVSCNLTPHEALEKIKTIERQMGRDSEQTWAPRPIDIDILFWKNQMYSENDLKIPHPQLTERSFCLAPLLDLGCNFKWPYADENAQKRLSQIYREQKVKLPKWVGILNITPDSFSQDGATSTAQALQKAEKLIADGVHILDIGAESTRPGATPISAEEEWERLKDVLAALHELPERKKLQISIDTYHWQTAVKALNHGVEIINEVSGFQDIEMLQVAKDSHAKWVFMHNLGIPASRDITLASDISASSQVLFWFENKFALLRKYISTENLIFDPGIGFGKTSVQSLEILKNISLFTALPIPIFVGHSRKSFLSATSEHAYEDRDIETVAISMELARQGVDYIRIHNMAAHRSAALALQSMQI